VLRFNPVNIITSATLKIRFAFMPPPLVVLLATKPISVDVSRLARNLQWSGRDGVGKEQNGVSKEQNGKVVATRP
jgi:hypothetical protein